MSLSINIERAKDGAFYIKIAMIALTQILANNLSLRVWIEWRNRMMLIYRNILWRAVDI